jgi:Trk-type K+ transport system membrane component
MFLSGVSFVIYYYIAKLNFRKVKQNDELWFYLATTIFAGAIATSILLAKTTKPLEPAFRDGFFQVISMITTTGYANTDYLSWPPAGLCLIFILLFAGASTGSTTGSIKMARHLVVIKSIKNAFVKLMHPNMVSQIRLNNKLLSVEANSSILSFVITYIFIFLVIPVIQAAQMSAHLIDCVYSLLGIRQPEFDFGVIRRRSIWGWQAGCWSYRHKAPELACLKTRHGKQIGDTPHAQRQKTQGCQPGQI